jgi:chromosome segregation ATPase
MSAELQQEVNTLKGNAKGVQAQLDAAKQMVNESQNLILQLRTNLNLFSSANQELATANQALKAELDALKPKQEADVQDIKSNKAK